MFNEIFYIISYEEEDVFVFPTLSKNLLFITITNEIGTYIRMSES